MSRLLLISDANILIDMQVGGLVDAMFTLPYEYATPALLYEQELMEYYPDLPGRGLRCLELEIESIQRMQSLAVKYAGVSSNDLAALALAEQVAAPLLTGDGKLRKVCLEENVPVHGTVWLVEQILQQGHIAVTRAESAYQRMEADGSRLPWDEVARQLKKFKN
ncbi:DUF3368 domain-containing protein [Thiohalophilus sp.]|uniref:DUF3368 domain-containing protein n=1 Tax=Thiohalophilus sp. TaxID=3028392 RepID=UPI002ACE3DB7|nr:DUF3368 domain-containing protein [Thiohalophilus sp.]MDZ7804938.1 DUF3368 domain-containing protein [Thiohalophilus sp.]